MQAGPWASYSSFQAIAGTGSATQTINCRALWCNAAGTLTIAASLTATPVSFTVLAGQILPFELNQGIVSVCPAGTVALA